MPQKQERRSDMWWRGHNDALAGDPPNESYYHYYYDYKLAYDETRREQRRTHRQQALSSLLRTTNGIVPLLLLVALIAGGWYWYNGRSTEPTLADATTPTATPRPTPRPTLTPFVPTPTPEPALRADGFAVITGTAGAPLRIRAEPGTGAPLVTRLNEGQNVRIIEGPQAADEYEWWRVEADGQTGWAAAPFLQPIEPPPTP